MLTAIGHSDRLTPVMRAHERRLGRPLRDALEERYRTNTLAEIACEFGVTEGAISKWFKRLDIPTSHRKMSVHNGDATESGNGREDRPTPRSTAVGPSRTA